MSELRLSGGDSPLDRNVAGRDDLLDLQKATGARLDDLVALSYDPFRSGTESDWEKARWVSELVDQLGINVHSKHQRGLHYIFVNRDVHLPDGCRYEGSEADLDFLGEAVPLARELGLLPPDAFPDRKAKLISDSTYRRHPQETRFEISAPDGGVPTLWVPQATSWSFTVERPGTLSLQPLVVEILTEADGIVEQLQPLAARYGCRLVVAGGFTGKSLAAEIFSRAVQDGRPRVVLQFHDADASGESMGIATARHLEFLVRQARARGEEVPRIYLDAVGITIEQVTAIEREIGRKIPRAPDVAREIGRVELEALPEYAPGWIEKELGGRLRALMAEVDYSPLDEAEEQIQDDLDERFSEVEARIEEITSRLEELLETPEAEELQSKLLNLWREFDVVRDEGQEIVDAFEVELPEPEVEDLDLDGFDWLLDSKRPYIEQLNAYRRREPVHRRRPEIALVERPGCEQCGADMRGRRPGARFCSKLCRTYASNARRDGRA